MKLASSRELSDLPEKRIEVALEYDSKLALDLLAGRSDAYEFSIVL